MSMPLPQEKEYTLADVLAWNDKERWELIYGVPVMLAPPARIHQKIVSEINRQLGNYLKGKRCEIYPAPFAVRLFERDGDTPENVKTMVEPDISVICDPSKLDRIGCKGAPDLIIEILSPSTQRHDRLTKFNLYASAGVREYWIIDPASKTALSFALENGHYAAKVFGTASDQMKVDVLEDCVIDLSQVFDEPQMEG